MTTTADGLDLAKRLRARADTQIEEDLSYIKEADALMREAAAFIERSCNTGQGVGEAVVDEVSIDELRSRAKSYYVENSWGPGSKLSAHSVIELMAAFAAKALREPPASCGYPDCGCDYDAVCNAALAARIPEASVEQAGRSSAADEYYQRGYGLRRRVLDYLNSDAPKYTLRHGFSEWEAASGTKFITPPVALAPPAGRQEAVADWRDDPSADERWNAGLDFALEQLCAALQVDPKSFPWDAATETLDGDVQAVIWRIIRIRMGEDWSPPSPSGADLGGEVVRLTRERDAAIAERDEVIAKSAAYNPTEREGRAIMDEAAAIERAEDLRSSLATAAKALEPFAEASKNVKEIEAGRFVHVGPSGTYHDLASIELPPDPFVRAREALSSITPAAGEDATHAS